LSHVPAFSPWNPGSTTDVWSNMLYKLNKDTAASLICFRIVQGFSLHIIQNSYSFISSLVFPLVLYLFSYFFFFVSILYKLCYFILRLYIINNICFSKDLSKVWFTLEHLVIATGKINILEKTIFRSAIRNFISTFAY
jgi:hypothetical protein